MLSLLNFCERTESLAAWRFYEGFRSSRQAAFSLSFSDSSLKPSIA